MKLEELLQMVDKSPVGTFVTIEKDRHPRVNLRVTIHRPGMAIKGMGDHDTFEMCCEKIPESRGAFDHAACGFRTFIEAVTNRIPRIFQ